MSVHVIPIITPHIDFATLLDASSKALGYDIARAVDRHGKHAQDVVKLLGVLSCFHEQENVERPLKSLIKEATSLCEHASYTMLFICSREVILKSMERTRLYHTIAEGLYRNQLAVVSGTLSMWRDSVVECTNSADHELRLLYDKVTLILEKQGIKDFWRKRQHNDKQTFYLEHK